MAYTRFKYITAAEYPSYDLQASGVTVESEFIRHANVAEQMIDAYCGPWPKFYSELALTLDGATGGGALLTAGTFGGHEIDYWAAGGLYVRAYTGAAAGQERLIVSSSGQTVTLASGWSVAAGDRVVLRQRSRFPRYQDFDQSLNPQVPPEITAATAYQIEYGVAFGSEAYGLSDPGVVADERGDITSETYGSGYSYSRDARRNGGGPLARWVAPKARAILRGFVTGAGRIC